VLVGRLHEIEGENLQGRGSRLRSRIKASPDIEWPISPTWTASIPALHLSLYDIFAIRYALPVLRSPEGPNEGWMRHVWFLVEDGWGWKTKIEL